MHVCKSPPIVAPGRFLSLFQTQNGTVQDRHFISFEYAGFHILWERHTESLSYTVIRRGPFDHSFDHDAGGSYRSSPVAGGQKMYFLFWSIGGSFPAGGLDHGLSADSCRYGPVAAEPRSTQIDLPPGSPSIITRVQRLNTMARTMSGAGHCCNHNARWPVFGGHRLGCRTVPR